MQTSTINLYLADDDPDDCIFFKEALSELPFKTSLTTANDGVELMELLNKKKPDLPHLLFLDLNMPRKTGIECLSEIKNDEELKNFDVIIFSTSYNAEIAEDLYNKGAKYYIKKPGEFSKLKSAISTILMKNNFSSTANKDEFLIIT